MTGQGFYGLAFNPFDKQAISEKDCFESNDFKEMTARLNYLKDTRGIGVFTARPGMGKSFALRCFAKSLNPNTCSMAYICLSTVSISEFYKQFCLALGLNDSGGKAKMYALIKEQVYYLYKEKKLPLIVAIDEAQYLNTSILIDIKMLMNYSYDSLNCFTMILCGESHLNNTLRKPPHEALRQRITIHYDYAGLSDTETADYILHKITRAGGSRQIIGDAALSAVCGWAQGSPRLIDNVMSDAITLGAQLERKIIDADTIFAAVNNQHFGG